MNRFAAGMVLAAAAGLAGCGGGTDGRSEAAQADEAGATTQATVNSLRTRLKAEGMRAESIAPEKAAEQLLDFAESRFPMHFPVHATTQTLAPFRFRAYPGGTYLGVATGAEGGYIANGVYVMGGPFGSQPTYVGLLTDFITPVDPTVPAGPAGTSNGCFDLAAMSTVGTRVAVTFRHTGSRVGTTIFETTVLPRTTFEGRDAIAILERTTGSLTVGGVAYPEDNERTVFGQVRGTTELVHYGWESQKTSPPMAGATTTSVVRGIATPEWIDRRAGLALGESTSLVHRYRVTMTTTTRATAYPGIPPSVHTTELDTDAWSTTSTFASRETLTVPAGTFAACRFEDRTDKGQAITTWVAEGSGLPIKTHIVRGGEWETSEAVTIER